MQLQLQKEEFSWWSTVLAAITERKRAETEREAKQTDQLSPPPKKKTTNACVECGRGVGG